MIRVVAYFELKEMRWLMPDSERQRLAQRFPSVSLCPLDDPSQLPAAITDAEVFVGWLLAPEHFRAARRLRWMHSGLAGIEANLFPELVASDVVLTNSAGLHSVSIPEHVLCQMLVLARNFHEALRLQARSEWNRFGVISHGATIRELHGSNLAILGAGAIGRELAQRAHALGMRVRIMRRDTSKPVAGAEAVVAPAAFEELLGWADFVVCALPLTPETDGVFGAKAFAAMRPNAFFINVGRGEHVEDTALVDALQRGVIAGAAIDAFREEPLPAAHPFWSQPNLVLTPHVSGYTPQYFDKMLALFEDNLARYVEGRPLRNVVDKRLGYAPGGGEA